MRNKHVFKQRYVVVSERVEFLYISKRNYNIYIPEGKLLRQVEDNYIIIR